MDRRSFVFSAAAAGLANPLRADEAQPPQTPEGAIAEDTYVTERGEILADLRYVIPADHKPVRVRLNSNVPTGEIHVAPSSFCLYWGLGNGEAIRYRVGIGSEARYRAGEFRIARKVTWPGWTPTRNMIRREPAKYGKYAGGMPGGPENPLGARALYLHYFGGGDTYMRIHGTPQPWTVTQASSSGCVRMINAHVIDLFARAPVGTRVKLYEKMDDYDPTDGSDPVL